MTNEDMVKRIGMAFIAAGHALVGTAKLEQPAPTTKIEPTAETATEEPAKRKRRTKAEIAAAKEAATTTPEATDTTGDFGGTTHEAEVVPAELTEDDLKKALVTYAKAEGKEKAFGVLGKFKAKKVADLAPENYAEVFELIGGNA